MLLMLFVKLYTHIYMIIIQESGLTCGARALAKHACRSISSYWGSLNGNGKDSFCEMKYFRYMFVFSF